MEHKQRVSHEFKDGKVRSLEGYTLTWGGVQVSLYRSGHVMMWEVYDEELDEVVDFGESLP